jgi:hypothetical protein
MIRATVMAVLMLQAVSSLVQHILETNLLELRLLSSNWWFIP